MCELFKSVSFQSNCFWKFMLVLEYFLKVVFQLIIFLVCQLWLEDIKNSSYFLFYAGEDNLIQFKMEGEGEKCIASYLDSWMLPPLF